VLTNNHRVHPQNIRSVVPRRAAIVLVLQCQSTIETATHHRVGLHTIELWPVVIQLVLQCWHTIELSRVSFGPTIELCCTLYYGPVVMYRSCRVFLVVLSSRLNSTPDFILSNICGDVLFLLCCVGILNSEVQILPRIQGCDVETMILGDLVV